MLMIRYRRWMLGVLCLAASVLAAGCKEIKDIGEELGLVEQREQAGHVEEIVTLDGHWLPAVIDVAGSSQGEWTARWWQWTARFPPGERPFEDRDGSQCALHQEGPVWFLAGTDGSFDAVRRCRVPAGKHVFIPLINFVQRPPGSCEAMQAAAAVTADHVISGLVLVDGRPLGELARMRVPSGNCFKVSTGAGEELLAGDGYWLMLKPLPPGTYQFAIAAGWRHGPREMMQNFRYELEVEPDPGDVDAEADTK